MNREEIRKLIGGYATGTLTDAESKLLFEAALDDQDLFEELAAEQELKELIEVPGVRSGLASALEPVAAREPRRWWTTGWIWGGAGALAAGILVAVITSRAPNPTSVEVAQVRSAVDAVSPLSDAPRPAPAQPAQSEPRREARLQNAQQSGTVVTQTPLPPPVLTDRESDRRAPEEASAKKSAVDAQQEQLREKEAAKQTPEPAAAAPPPQAPVTQAQTGARQGDQTALARDQAAQNQPAPAQQSVTVTQAAPLVETQQNTQQRQEQFARLGGAAGQGQAPQAKGSVRATTPPAPAARPTLAKIAAASSAAFTFSTTANAVQITPGLDGFLQTSGSAVRGVKRGVAVTVPFPAGVRSMVVTFSTREIVGAQKDSADAVPARPGVVQFPPNSPEAVTVEISVP